MQTTERESEEGLVFIMKFPKKQLSLSRERNWDEEENNFESEDFDRDFIPAHLSINYQEAEMTMSVTEINPPLEKKNMAK